MKIRKALAVVLSLAMTVTLMPATAFASSDLSVNKTVKVASDTVIDQDLIVTAKATNDWTVTAGKITENIVIDVTNGKFTDVFKTAEANGQALEATQAVATPAIAIGDAVLTVGLTKANNADTAAVESVKINSIDKTSADLIVTINPGNDLKVTEDSKLTFTFKAGTIKAGKEEGAVKVNLAGDSFVSTEEVTIATVVGGETTATVTGSVDTKADVVTDTAGIKIKEVTASSVTTNQILKIKAPKGVEFKGIKVTGGLFTNGAGDKQGYENYSQFLAEAKKTNTSLNANDFILTNDKTTMYVYLEVSGTATTTTAETAILTPNVEVTDDAKEGDLSFSIAGMWAAGDGDKISDESGLVLLKYGLEDVSVKTVDEIPTIVAGQVSDTDDEPFWSAIIIKENVGKSLTREKKITITLPDDVEVTDLEGAASNIKYSTDKDDTLDDVDTNKSLTVSYDKEPGSPAKDSSKFSITLYDTDAAGNNANEILKPEDDNTVIVYIPITAKANFTGDVVATVKGKDFDETEVTIAKVVAPVEISATVTNVVNGAKNQALADITVKENAAGYLGKDGDVLYLAVDTNGLSGGLSFDNASVKVTDGDLDLSSTITYKTIDGVETIQLKVKDPSEEKASTFVLSGLTLTLARYLPEGEYSIGVYTYEEDEVADADLDNAAVRNPAYEGGDFGKQVYACLTPIFKITTAADTAQTGIVANFYLDGSKNSTYTVNGVDATMDAAAYLDSNNRTMVPIRYVAYALGLADSDISYSTGDSTATLSGLTNVVKVTTGSNVLQCSNGNVTMDTVAVNNGGRLYVPARFIAQAFGAEVAWDQATKTVTITK